MIGDTRAIPSLIKALDDNDPEIRWSAINALGNVGDLTAVVALEELSEFDREKFIPYRGHEIDNRAAARDAIDRIKSRAT